MAARFLRNVRIFNNKGVGRKWLIKQVRIWLRRNITAYRCLQILRLIKRIDDGLQEYLIVEIYKAVGQRGSADFISRFIELAYFNDHGITSFPESKSDWTYQLVDEINLDVRIYASCPFDDIYTALISSGRVNELREVITRSRHYFDEDFNHLGVALRWCFDVEEGPIDEDVIDLLMEHHLPTSGTQIGRWSKLVDAEWRKRLLTKYPGRIDEDNGILRVI